VVQLLIVAGFKTLFKHDDVCDIFCLHILNRFGETLGNRYGPGTGPIWLYDVACAGSETHLFNCRNRGWGVHNCRHREYVSIRCSRRNVDNVVEYALSGVYATSCNNRLYNPLVVVFTLCNMLCQLLCQLLLDRLHLTAA